MCKLYQIITENVVTLTVNGVRLMAVSASVEYIILQIKFYLKYEIFTQ